MSKIKLAVVGTAAVLLMTGCASSHKGAALPASAPPAVTAPASSAPAATAPAAAAAAATTGLSGKWSGQYSGAYSGTFNLSWRQSGSRLSGTIRLSTPPDSLSLHGTVQNGAIRFGTVGSVGITYSGTVSGSSMSGTYQVDGANGSAGGPWSASRTS
jgi:hypothetical protein